MEEVIGSIPIRSTNHLATNGAHLSAIASRSSKAERGHRKGATKNLQVPAARSD